MKVDILKCEGIDFYHSPIVPNLGMILKQEGMFFMKTVININNKKVLKRYLNLTRCQVVW